ncbi:carboxypeptidase-like regulatory domain-containing protein [Mucilaginibacter sp. UR6-11]|uniref:carboxypeptidase-like regulatory domain-containing protein n=1 Tax=Mucilaginibacter sp. UR6-11 TaxID=1435644 RepID=UPI001E35C2D8|nr:carboxypeptidase-like regulatory domain-containing protein [Mucilaginibacter sp. UR6-11]MCC8424504.1 carboxypeptidase-like regulatory domain-containing protein [Mucilaginibacter sp. UR6-11]
MKYLFALLFLSFAIAASAQVTEKPLVQFSGVTHNADSARVIVPYVNVTNLTTHRQVYITNYEGYFSFVVHEQDTLRFSSVGYNPITVVIPANVTSHSVVMNLLLKPQIINLPAFRVFPWATTDEFRKDFLALKVADDDLEIARKNLSGASIRAMEASMPRSGYESFSVQDMHNSIVNSHSITNPLLNPFAWGSLIKDIAAGDKSSSK